MRTLLILCVLGLMACGDDDKVEVVDNNTNNSNNTNNTNNSNNSNNTNNTNNSTCPTSTDPNAVMTGSGAVIGTSTNGVRRFAGIPYAAPPVGPLRFQPPQAVGCFDAPLEADTLGPECPQVVDGTFRGEEDCLTLNIWAPEGATNAPVMFYIHGGGNAVGSGSQPTGEVFLFDGEALARDTGRVVVTMNYRLGQLGFLTHPSLDGDSPAGNYGLRDQIAALEYVQENIASFGGDPDRVLLFGESAGGLDSCLLWSSDQAAGLFSSVLTQSGGCAADTRDEQVEVAQTFVEAVGCTEDTAACLRALNVETLMTTLPTDVNVAGTSVGYGPSVDGDLLKDKPLDLVRAKKHSAVPIVFGANSYETSRAVPATVTENNYETLVRAQFGPLADQILAEYPLSAYPTARRAMVRITSDAKFICPQRVYAKAAAENQEAPVFRYMFTQGLTQNAMLRPFGAFHGAELLFVFERFAAAGYTPSDDEAALADAMQAYWASAADGSFAPEGLTPWEPWDATDPYLLLEGGNVSIQRGWDTEKCDFWEPLITATF